MSSKRAPGRSQANTRLSTIHKSTVHSILDEAEIKPFRIRYYCENRDPDFDSKMHNVLLVYKQLSMQFDEDSNLLPDEHHGAINRDYEYKRLGILSLLAGIDLQTGEAIPLVSETHNSKDYVEFLKILDNKYPKGEKIRIVLDNLKVHTSQETRKYLATVPGRLELILYHQKSSVNWRTLY